MLSFWEKNSFLNYDYIIIGSGILGLSCACSIKEKNPSTSVLILEKGIFPEGASTKNAGFACFGSLTEILSDFERIGEDDTISLVKKRWEGINLLRKRLGDDKIGFLNYGGYELIGSKHFTAPEKLKYVNDKLGNIFNEETFEIRNDKIKKFGFNDQIVESLVYNKFESQINTGKMMSSLIEYAARQRIKIINGCQVESISEKQNYVNVITQNYSGKERIDFCGKRIVICTNAFTKKLIPSMKIVPGRGHVIITKPIKGLKFKEVFHFDEGFYYFRNFDNRIIFGGGRNLDFQKEETDAIESNEKIVNDLKYKLEAIILPEQKFEIDYSWSGIMGFTENKLPIIENISDRVISVVSCNGMGVSLASYMANGIV
jgi:glycine/D-amino acid oxidase-like deaminating enzyme